MKKVVGLLLLTSLMTFAHANGNVENGKKLAAACGACHGMNGVSNNPLYPNLAGQSQRYTYLQLQAFKKGANGGRVNPLMNGMAANLSDQDMQDLGAYFASLPAGHGETAANLATLGETIYRGGNLDKHIPACMACHGPDGKGNDEAGFPALAGQHAEYVLAQLQAYAKGERGKNMMSDISARLSKEEMEAVASFIQGLH
ncbi:MAG: cytochrome c4 [Legionellales bacterium]|nr:cytochrome c4 [Legionellales bacterium]